MLSSFTPYANKDPSVIPNLSNIFIHISPSLDGLVEFNASLCWWDVINIIYNPLDIPTMLYGGALC